MTRFIYTIDHWQLLHQSELTAYNIESMRICQLQNHLKNMFTSQMFKIKEVTSNVIKNIQKCSADVRTVSF